ncbi:hypothetical protein VUR80DRAFT_4619 [Thermomyces stellatus]
MDTTPIHASQVMRFRVPCSETALRPIEVPNIKEPPEKIKTSMEISEYFAAKFAKQDGTGVVDRIDLRVIEFK